MKNIIDERDANNIKRQKFKKKFDDSINLSADSEYRLLDEGVVVSGEDTVRFIIAKGTMEKFYNGENEYLPNIDDDYKGFINLGHDDFYANPICLIGEWSKKDLELVDIGGERKGLNVDVKLYDWHPYTQIIHNLPYTIGLSAEFYGHVDFEKSETIGETVYDEICITDFAVVGYGANVTSNGISLGITPEGENMKKDELKALQEALSGMKSASELEEVKETEEALEPEKLDEAPEEEESDDAEDEAIEESEEAEEESEEVDLSEILSAIYTLTEKVSELTEENSQLRTKLEAKDNEIKTFAEKFESLSVSLNPDFKGEKKEELSEDRYGGFNDGIGGW